MKITGISQFQFETGDLEKALLFYHQILGLSPLPRKEHALSLGMASGRIDIFEAPHDTALRAANAVAIGSQSFCLRAVGDPVEAMARLKEAGAQLAEEQIFDTDGALGPAKSLYLFDFDHNLVELAFYEVKARPLQVLSIDHLGLVSGDYRQSLAFYESLYALPTQTFAGHGTIQAGRQKLEVQQQSPRYAPHAPYAAIGSAAYTMTVAGTAAQLRGELETLKLPFREDRAALCLNDPDGNLLRLLPEEGA